MWLRLHACAVKRGDVETGMDTRGDEAMENVLFGELIVDEIRRLHSKRVNECNRDLSPTM